MKLSSLINYRVHLESLSPRDDKILVESHIGPSLHYIRNHDLQFDDHTTRLIKQYDDVQQSFVNYSTMISDLQNEIKKLIDQIEPRYFIESYQIYNREFINDTSKYILERKLSLSEAAKDHIHARIRRHGNWQHSGMIIRPGLENWIDDLVGCDPLYLVDRDMELLEPTLEKFNDQYRRRLRTYFLNNTNDNQALSMIPDRQFAFCLVYFFFNFMPLEVIKNYLIEIHDKLKPGGTLIFTFNNCDLPNGVDLVERHFMCYTPGKMLLSLAESIGYEISHTYQIDGACTWVEVQKSGTLTTLRGGQSLAEIIPK